MHSKPTHCYTHLFCPLIIYHICRFYNGREGSKEKLSFELSWLWRMEEDLEIAIKVVIVGNGAVGKSSMIQRYCKGIFTKDYKKTIGVDFLEKEIEWVEQSNKGDKEIKVENASC